MLKRVIICAALALTPVGPGAVAQGVDAQQVVDQLRDQGYRDIRISQTFLGRTRIVATNSEYRREIVINPATGAIVRDYWRVLSAGDDDDDNDGGRIVRPSSSDDDRSSTSSSTSRDDDDDDSSSSSSSSSRSSSSSSSSSSDDDDDDGGSDDSSSGSDDNDDDNDD
jgi:hypothetical protein